MLGQVVVHDVLLQDGSPNLSRSDLTLPGRGPEFGFSRTYNNLPPARGPQPLGPGWRHNYQMALQGLSTTEFGNGPIPDWAAALKKRFVRPSQLPGNDIDDWNMVSVNGTTFIK